MATRVMPSSRPRFKVNRYSVAGFSFVLPAILLFAAFIFLPMIYAFWISLQKWDILKPPTFVGPANYEALAADPVFHSAILNTLYYILGSVPAGIMMSLALAILLNQQLRFRYIFRSALFLPVVTSMVAVGLLWRYMFASEYGVLNYLLTLLGLPTQNWLVDPRLAMPAVIVASIWRQVGYNMMIFLAGLQGIPDHLYEAAAIDGASRWSTFWRITLPLLRPTTLFVVVMSIINSFRSFEMIYVMTGGGPSFDTQVLVLYLYREAFQMLHMGIASAAAYVLFIILMVLTILQMKFFGREVEY